MSPFASAATPLVSLIAAVMAGPPVPAGPVVQPGPPMVVGSGGVVAPPGAREGGVGGGCGGDLVGPVVVGVGDVEVAGAVEGDPQRVIHQSGGGGAAVTGVPCGAGGVARDGVDVVRGHRLAPLAPRGSR